jgi:hypothetical protein
LGAPQDEGEAFGGIEEVPHPEEAAKAVVSKDAPRRSSQPWISCPASKRIPPYLIVLIAGDGVPALSERGGRMTPANSSEYIAWLETLDVVVDEETPSRALGRVLDLARAERLTAYRAAYLELAMRLGIPLASKDADLCDAAERLGVSVLRAA